MNLTGGIVPLRSAVVSGAVRAAAFGQQSQTDAGEVTPARPPVRPMNQKLKKRAIMTTIIAAVIWAIIAYVILAASSPARISRAGRRALAELSRS